ncbi:MAG TPA: glycine cleavage T C-terminal barrel domain-containing protein, partial [Alphaproteobacteria bacterium]
PYGTETMHLLRAEKGYIMVGQESDGTVTPIDLGLERMIGRTKADFIGKRSLARPDLVRPDRKQLVGLATEDGAVVLEEGVHLVAAERLPRPPVPALGHVTSSYFSPNLGRSIALGLVRGGRARMGQRLYAATPEGQVPVIVTDPVFLDPDGTRLDG